MTAKRSKCNNTLPARTVRSLRSICCSKTKKISSRRRENDRLVNPKSLTDRLGVCSWSLQAANPQDLAAKLLATSIRRVQLGLDPLRQTPEVWGDSATLLQQKGISIISGMFGCVGEDYSTLE